jgi:peptidoglycan/xylan/chitin deacetylase (PgdA/CDA1 family)
MKPNILIVTILSVLLLFAEAKTAEASYIDISSLNVKVAAVMYHRISQNPADWNDYNISPDQLESDFITFISSGFTPITISEYIYMSSTFAELKAGRWKNIEKLKEFESFLAARKNPLLITFDDGYADGYDIVLPLLKQYKIKANFFIVGSYCNDGNNGFLSRKEIREMYDSGFAEFGSHSYSLHDLSLTEMNNLIVNSKFQMLDTIRKDYEKNNLYLKDILGSAPSSLSYPYGIYSNYSEKLFDMMGFAATFVTESAPFKKIGDGTKMVTRINRSHSFSADEFVRRVIAHKEFN